MNILLIETTCRCRLNWKLEEIERAQDGTYTLFYQTPDGGKKVSLTSWYI